MLPRSSCAPCQTLNSHIRSRVASCVGGAVQHGVGRDSHAQESNENRREYSYRRTRLLPDAPVDVLRGPAAHHSAEYSKGVGSLEVVAEPWSRAVVAVQCHRPSSRSRRKLSMIGSEGSLSRGRLMLTWLRSRRSAHTALSPCVRTAATHCSRLTRVGPAVESASVSVGREGGCTLGAGVSAGVQYVAVAAIERAIRRQEGFRGHGQDTGLGQRTARV